MAEQRNNAQYGGQAVIEGVMMRSPRYFAVACRRINKEIVIQQESVESLLRRFQWLNKPFLRGTLALIDALVLGVKSLTYSANIAMEDIENADPKKQKAGPGTASGLFSILLGILRNIVLWSALFLVGTAGECGSKKKSTVNDIAIGGTLVLGLGLGVGLFIILPHIVIGFLEKPLKSSLLLNLAEGIFRLVLFVAYIAAISLMKDIRRVFEYHGAEHKVINTFEAGLELTPENFAKHGTIHQRCGTSFILFVLVMSIFLFAFLGWHHVWYLRIISRLALLPVLAGIAYETIRYAGKHKDSKVVNLILSPGLLLQRLTTRQPSDDQVEVALKALEAVLDKERESGSLAPQAAK
ncbi:MAG: DUF1385 domain-containing protein [Armatimonadota bacterium]|nr:DUF1385 domain-containing protein [Armatimonadota bacterium]